MAIFHYCGNIYTIGDSKDIDASDVAYDNTTSGLTSTDVQGAIDEIVSQSSDLCIGGVSANYIHTDPNCVGGGDANGN